MEKELNLKQGSLHKLFLGHLRNNMKDVIKPKTVNNTTLPFAASTDSVGLSTPLIGTSLFTQ
jgi:hypothetical protein